MSRRAAITPASAGLPQSGIPRRRQGLRREEVAALAGVSVDYYTKLEQGRFGNVSEQVLAAVSDALQLNRLEREHLVSLTSVRKQVPVAKRPARERASASIQALITSMSATPAIVQNSCMDILASNRAANLLLTDFSARPRVERNTARWVFLDPSARTRFPDWDEVATTTVAVLRAARDPRRPNEGVEDIINELTARSSDFAQRWSEYRLFRYENGKKTFFHEGIGAMAINYNTLEIPNTGGQTLCMYTTDPGSPSEEKLRSLLGQDAVAVSGD